MALPKKQCFDFPSLNLQSKLFWETYFSLKCHNLAKNHPNFASWRCFGILRRYSWRWSQRFLKLMHPGLRNWRKRESRSYWRQLYLCLIQPFLVDPDPTPFPPEFGHGQWCSWQVYGPCSTSFGPGVQGYRRKCGCPPPGPMGNDCPGLPIKREDCGE